MGKITKKEVKQRKTLFPKSDSYEFVKSCAYYTNLLTDLRNKKKSPPVDAVDVRRSIMKLTAAAKEILRKEGIQTPSILDKQYSIEAIHAFIWLSATEKSKKDAMEIENYFSMDETPANHSRGLFLEGVFCGEKEAADEYLTYHWSTKDEVLR